MSEHINDFNYDDLPDPRTHIRLLQIQRAPQSGGVVEIRLSVWPISEIPDYQAVSYTWGDEDDPERISICDFPGLLLVRRNCADVLRQVHRCVDASSTAYFWLDAICINQENDTEKSSQVSVMADIYQNAQCVLACVGMHDSSSEWLVKTFTNFEDMLETDGVSLLSVIPPISMLAEFAGWGHGDQSVTTDNMTPEARCVETVTHWLRAMTNEDVLDLMNALDKMAQRAYFWRVWILQELYLARKIRIICGFDELSIASLLFWWRYARLHLVSELREKLPEGYLSHAPWTELMYLLNSGGSGLGSTFEDILIHSIHNTDRGTLTIGHDDANELCLRRQCQDPRDIVYGTLRLLEWDGIQPDYSISICGLATKALGKFAFLSTRQLHKFIARLGINRHNPELFTLRLARAMMQEFWPDVYDPGAEENPPPVQQVGGGFQLTSYSLWRIVPSHREGLYYCRILGPSGQVAAVSHLDVRVGDWLVRTTRHTGVVSRRLSSDTYEILGPVRFLSEDDLPQDLVGFWLWFDVEDVLLHLSQGDCLSDEFKPTEEDELDIQIIIDLQFPICKGMRSSTAWRPESDYFVTMFYLLDMVPDTAFMHLFDLCTTAYLPYMGAPTIQAIRKNLLRGLTGAKLS